MKMSREELIELAGLDALGLLDLDEMEAFEAAFRRAPAPLRAELRDVQSQIASLGELLTEAEPAADLRERTLAQVAQYIEQAPAPTLKRRVLGTFERFIEEDLQGSMQFPIEGGTLPGRRDWIERMVAGRVAPMWRIAALVLLTTTIGIGWFGVDAYSKAMRIADAMSHNRTDEILRFWFKQLPEDYWFNPESRMTAFSVGEHDFKGRAMLAVINSQDRGFLAAINMPASNDSYRLMMGFDDPSHARTVAEFYSKGGTCAVPISLASLDVSGAKWWVMGPSASGEGAQTALLQIIP